MHDIDIVDLQPGEFYIALLVVVVAILIVAPQIIAIIRSVKSKEE
jgi:hypothetical protein